MTRTIIIAAVLIAALLGVTWILYPASAQAGYYRTVTRCDEFRFHCHKKRIWVGSKKKRPDYRYYAPPRDYEDDRGPICLYSTIKVVSTEHTSRENAMEAAKKMWAFNAQWEHGSRFMDITLATDYAEHCGPSNAMDTASGRINEAVNQLAGNAGVNVRCVIRARPCRARLEQAEGHR